MNYTVVKEFLTGRRKYEVGEVAQFKEAKAQALIEAGCIERTKTKKPKVELSDD